MHDWSDDVYTRSDATATATASTPSRHHTTPTHSQTVILRYSFICFLIRPYRSRYHRFHPLNCGPQNKCFHLRPRVSVSRSVFCHREAPDTDLQACGPLARLPLLFTFSSSLSSPPSLSSSSPPHFIPFPLYSPPSPGPTN